MLGEQVGFRPVNKFQEHGDHYKFTNLRCCDMLFPRLPELPKDPSFVLIPLDGDFASYAVLVEVLLPTFYML